MLITRTGDYKLTVSWTPTWTSEVSPTTGYTIERKMGDDDYEFIATVGADITSYEDTVTLDDMAYKYRVRTDIQGGSSNWQESSVFTLTAPTAYSTGWMEVIDNAVLSGTIITVGGQKFIQDFDWFKGINEPATMQNIAEAINTKSAFVRASAGTNQIDITALRPGADGNARNLLATGYGSTISYHYGYPSYGAVEPNVKLQWKYDELSGTLYDEVSGFPLNRSGTATYNQVITGPWRGLSPGIYCNTALFSYSDPWGSSLNPYHPVFSKFIVEVVAKKVSGLGINQNMFVLSGGYGGSYASSLRGMWYNDKIRIGEYELYGADITDFTPVHAVWNDGKFHHYRFVCEWRQQVKLYIDGYYEGQTNWTYYPGLGDPWGWSPGIWLGGIQFGGPGYVMGEARYTVGNSTNNSMNNNSTGPGVVFSGSTLTGGHI